MMFAFTLGLMAIPMFSQYEQQGMVASRISVTAGQFQKVSKAATDYIRSNYSAIESVATPTTPATISVAALQSTGFLQSGISDTNPYGQTWSVQILQPSPGKLQALVLSSGGEQIAEKLAPKIAAQTGSVGGFVPYNGQYGTLSPSAAQGAYGGWQVSMSGYANPGAGHLAGLLAFDDGNLQSNYLYRVAVPGQPQLNAMQTDLSMTDQGGTKHSVNGADVISTQSLKALSDGTQGTPSVSMANGALIAWNQVAEGGVLGLKGANGQSVFVESNNGVFRLVNSPWNKELFTVDQSGNVVTAGNVQVGGRIGVLGMPANSGYPAGWTGGVHTRDLYAEGGIGVGVGGGVSFYANNSGYGGVSDTFSVGSRLILGTAFGQANAGWGCGPNGEIAANANGSGQLMACQNGVWSGVGGGQFRGYYVPPAQGYYGVANPWTGGYSCPAGSNDYGVQVIWYGSYGYQTQHLCYTPG